MSSIRQGPAHPTILDEPEAGNVEYFIPLLSSLPPSPPISFSFLPSLLSFFISDSELTELNCPAADSRRSKITVRLHQNMGWRNGNDSSGELQRMKETWNFLVLKYFDAKILQQERKALL